MSNNETTANNAATQIDSARKEKRDWVGTLANGVKISYYWTMDKVFIGVKGCCKIISDVMAWLKTEVGQKLVKAIKDALDAVYAWLEKQSNAYRTEYAKK